jgi:hypothetical protein
MSLIKLFLGGNNLVFSRPERVWSVTSRLGTGKWLTLFYSVLQAFDSATIRIIAKRVRKKLVGAREYKTAFQVFAPYSDKVSKG